MCFLILLINLFSIAKQNWILSPEVCYVCLWNLDFNFFIGCQTPIVTVNTKIILFCLHLLVTNSLSHKHIMPFKYELTLSLQMVWANKIEQILIIENRRKCYSISWHTALCLQKMKMHQSVLWLIQALICSVSTQNTSFWYS